MGLRSSALQVNAQTYAYPSAAAPGQPIVYQQQHQQDSMTATAQKAQQAAAKGAQINTMMGAMMLGMAMSQKPPNMLLAMMGAMMLAQGMQQNQAAQDANRSLATSSHQPVALPPNYTVAGYPQANAGLAALGNAGYRVSSNGVVLPNGRMMPASSFNSPQALSSAGFSNSTINTAKGLAAQARQAASPTSP